MSEYLTNVVIAGLGGQGVLKASDILADAVFRAGFDVKKAEVHGMSQRGGSVNTDVRFGRQVFSPMVPFGEADYLVVLNPTQLENNRGYLRPGGILIEPSSIDPAQLPHPRSLNVALIGRFSRHLDLPDECWEQALAANLRPDLLALNRQAFALGRDGVSAA